jgi:hypothetical protein
VFSDLLHVAARPRDLAAVLAVLARARHELDRHDLKPNLLEAGLTGVALYRRVRNGTLRHPHGKPVVPS